MIEKKITEEYLEAIWTLLERKHDLGGKIETGEVEDYFGSDYNSLIINQLLDDDKITIEKSFISFTDGGRRKSRQLIRAHRLAERLLYDVLGIDDYEVGACEFEHIIDTNLIDSICTLLGHPRRCPDGMPIPDGECCRNSKRSLFDATVSVQHMKVGDTGRVASVNADDDTRLHILETLQIRPGSMLRVHQTAPTIVIECEGSTTAIDDSIASQIHVWPGRTEEVDEARDEMPEHRYSRAARFHGRGQRVPGEDACGRGKGGHSRGRGVRGERSRKGFTQRRTK